MEFSSIFMRTARKMSVATLMFGESERWKLIVMHTVTINANCNCRKTYHSALSVVCTFERSYQLCGSFAGLCMVISRMSSRISCRGYALLRGRSNNVRATGHNDEWSTKVLSFCTIYDEQCTELKEV